MKVMVNRVLLAFKVWEDRKKEMEPLRKAGAADDTTMARLQLDHLRRAKHRLRETARPDEQPFVALLRNQITRLEKQLYPNLLVRIVSRLKERYIDGPAYLIQQQQQRTANMVNLKTQLKASGLGSVAGKLENHLDPDHHQVRLPLDCQLGQDKRLNFDLHFEKDPHGNFQLHRIDGSLLNGGKIARSHEFELTDWPNLQTNQIWSLLEGRALKQHYVDASGHEQDRWVELGPNGPQHYDPQYVFNVKTALSAVPAITGNKAELISYLGNGQQVATHWKQNGQFQSIYVQADPASQTLKLFDARQKPITAEQLIQKTQHQANIKKPEVPVQKIKKGMKNGQGH
jgi:hypothetical protein